MKLSLVMLLACVVGLMIGRYLIPHVPEKLPLGASPVSTQSIDKSDTTTDDLVVANAAIPARIQASQQCQGENALLAPPATTVASAQDALVTLHDNMDKLMGGDLGPLIDAYVQIEGLSDQQKLDLIDITLTQGFKDDMQSALVVTSLVKTNPQMAYEAMLSHSNEKAGKDLAMGVLSVWAQTDPDRAFNELLSIEEGEERGYRKSRTFNAIFSKIASERDTAKLINYLSRMSESQESDAIAKESAVTSYLAQLESGVEFADVYYSLQLAEEETRVLNSVLTSWARQSANSLISQVPAGSLDTVDEFSVRMLSNHMLRFNEAINPNEAAEWLISHANTENRLSFSAQISDAWVATDPRAAVAWYERQEGFSQEHKASLLSMAIYDDTDFVIDMLPTLQNESLQRSVSLRVYQQLLDSQPEQAEAFIADSPYKEAIKTKVSQRQEQESLRRSGLVDPIDSCG